MRYREGRPDTLMYSGLGNGVIYTLSRQQESVRPQRPKIPTDIIHVHPMYLLDVASPYIFSIFMSQLSYNPIHLISPL